MNKSVEILIELNGSRYYLDYDAVDGVRLNYNINRIQELDKLDSSYSQSIKLVNSKNNQNVLGYISNLNIESGTFDPNRKTRAYLLVNGVIIFEGFIQLLGIEYNDNGSIFYDSVIYADNANLYTSIESKFLKDLDFSRFNYIFNRDTFLSTATSSCDKDAIIFPLIDYGANWKYNQINGTGSNLGLSASQIDLIELYPATYVKTIVDQIFTDAGYTYESEFLNTPHFKSLIVPFSNEELVNSDDIGNNNRFLFSSSTASIFTQSSASTIDHNIVYDISELNSDAGNRFNVSTQEYSNDGSRRYERFGIDLDFSVLSGRYEITRVQTSIVGTNALFRYLSQATNVSIKFLRQYNPSTDSLDTNPTNEFYRKPIYRATYADRTRVDGVITGALSTLSTKGYQTNGFLNPVGVEINVLDDKIELRRGGFNVFENTNFTTLGLKFVFNDISRLTSTETIYCPWLDGSAPTLLPLFPNEKVEIKIEVEYQPLPQGGKIYYPNESIMISAAGSYPITTTYSSQPFLYEGIGVLNSDSWDRDSTINYNNKIKNDVTSQVSIGTSLPISINLPENVKQIDFLKSIIKMFNLYVEPVKGKINTFRIEPRDDYYKNSELKDWSSKVDLSKPIKSDILSNTQAKETILKYSDDDDFYNELYRKSFNESYGEYKYIINNEFVTGENKIELIFSPTILKNISGSDIIISTIQKNNLTNQVEKPGSNIRILYCDVLNLPNNQTITIDSTIFSQYIYAGHIDNPYDPDLDLSFNLPKKLYYDFIINGERLLTYNGLYNTYHRNQFSELNNTDSRLVKVNLQLDETDIYDFKFSDTIYLWVNDNINGYFRVNSISEYDPINMGSVSVELIKIDFSPSTRLIGNTRFDTNNIQPNSLNLGSLNQYDNPAIVVGRRNIIKGIGNEVSGENNLVTGNNVKIKGSGNFIDGDSINLNGNLNNISGSKIDIIGSQNIGSASIVNGRLVGDNNTIKQSIDKLQITGDNNVVGDTSTTSNLENIYIFGDNNSIEQDVNNVVLFGNSATISNSNTFIINGLDFETQKLVVNGKTTNTFTDVDNYIVYGQNNQVVNIFDNIDSKVVGVGDNNFIYSVTGDRKFLLGDFNQLSTSTASFMMLIGINNDVIGLKDSFVFGSNNGFNTNLQPGLFQNNYVLGNSNVATFNPFFGPGFNKNIVVGDSNTFPSIIRPFENNITIGNSNNFEHRNNLFTASGYNKNLVIGDTNNFTMPAQKSIIIGDNNTEFPIRNAVFASSSIIIGNNNKLGSSDIIVEQNILQNDFVLGDNNFVGFSKYSKVLGNNNDFRSNYTTLDGESNNINIVPYGTTFSTFNKNINIRGNNNNITYGGSVSHSIFGSDPVISGRFKDIKYVVDPTMNILGSRQSISLGPILNPRKVVGYTYSFGVNPPIFTANIITNNNLYDVFSYSTAIPNRMINASQNLVDLVSYNQNAGLNTYITNRVGSLVKTKSEGLSASKEPVKNYPYELASDEDYSSYNVNYIESQSVTSNFTFSSLFRLENGLSKDDNLLVTNSIDTLPHNYIINSNDSYNGNFDATYSLQTTYKRFNTNYTNYGTASTKEILSYFRLTKNVGSDNPPIIPYYKLDIKSTILFGTATQSSNFLLQSPAREQEDTLFINYDNSIGPVTYPTFGFTYSVVNKSNNALNAVPPTIQYSPISSGSNRLLEIKYIDNTIGARVYDMYVHIQITAYYMDWKNKYTKKEIPY